MSSNCGYRSEKIDPNSWIDYAKNLLSKRKRKLEDLKGKRIRVVRVVVFEGDSEDVLKQLARSLPEGELRLSVAGEPTRGRVLTVTVAQDEIKVLDE